MIILNHLRAIKMQKYHHFLVSVFIYVSSVTFVISSSISAPKETLQPFVLDSVTTSYNEQVITNTEQKLIGTGFALLREHVPFGQNIVILETNNVALKVAAKSQRRAHGAPQRISILQYGNEAEVSYAKPLYFEKAYWLDKDEESLDEKHQMNVVAFERPNKKTYLYYKLLVNNYEVEALNMKFRMALYFPDLPMTGKHGFTKSISSPGEIANAFEDIIEKNR